MNYKEIIFTRFLESVAVKNTVLNDENLINDIIKITDKLIETIKTGGCIYVCGNGGSASDALHMAGELVGRFRKERKACACVALNSDIASMTAIANDYGYDTIFERAVEAYVQKNDILLGISTSGNSTNVLRALEKANSIGAKTVALLGKTGGKIAKIADSSIIVPSDITSHIQETHIVIIHIICELIEEALD